MQRRRNLEALRSEVETRRRLVEEKIISGGTSGLPEWTQELAQLETRLAEIDQELGGDSQARAYHRAVDQLGQWYGDMQQRMTKLERRIEDWIAAEARERHERQDQLDDTLDELRKLIQTNASERRQQIHHVYLIQAVFIAVELALLAAFIYVVR